LPTELGGREVPENTVYISDRAWRIKENSTTELLALVGRGEASEISVIPEYRGNSFVPSILIVTAGKKEVPPIYHIDIHVW